MYFVELTNGEIITGSSTTWQALSKMISEIEDMSIRQLGLTDMVHVREVISGADAYYYFTDAEATISNRVIDGEAASVTAAPRVIGEEIAGFYSSDSSRKIFEDNIQNCDSNIVSLENRLAELRATNISSDKIQKIINMEISQKQGVLDQMKNRRDRLVTERNAAIDAGGFIVTRRLQVCGGKFPVNSSPETIAPVHLALGRIRIQNPQYWIGSVRPDFNNGNGRPNGG